MRWPLRGAPNRSPIILIALLLVLSPALAIFPVGQVSAAGVVGNGSLASCTADALQDALDGGGLVTFDCGGAHTIELSDELEVGPEAEPTVVDGAGLITLSGASQTRIFDMASGADLTLQNLTVSNGQATRGAGVQNRGSLTVINTTFSNNVASNQHGGAILSFPNAGLTVEDSRFLNNSSSGPGGGAIFISAGGTATITDAEFNVNTTTGPGGAIRTNTVNEVSISSSQFIENSSGREGGAIYNNQNTNVTIDRSDFIDNTAWGRGAAIFNGPGVALSLSSSLLSGNIPGDAGGVLSDFAGGTIANNDGGNTSITNSSILNSPAYAIRNTRATLDISNSTIQGTEGAILNNGGDATVLDTTIDDSGGDAATIWINVNASLTLIRSTLSNNQAGSGAFDSGGIVSISGVVNVYNSTFANNSVSGAVTGRDIDNYSATVRIYNSTLESVANDSIGAPTTILKNSIIAGGPGGSCTGVGFTSLGYNISDDNTCNLDFTSGDGDQENVDPMLEDLGDYGGPTQTRRPRPNSPAVDAIPLASCAVDDQGDPLPDQRGVPRPQNTDCDIGSVELTDQPRITDVTATPDTVDEPGSTLISIDAFVDPTPANPTPTPEYAFDCDGDTVFELTQQASNEAICEYDDDGLVTVNAQFSANGLTVSGSVEVTINNLPPMIDEITTEIDGDDIVITVAASDPAGAFDPLEYAFDCDNDGDIDIEPQPENTATCPLIGLGGTQQIRVVVSDGDGGEDTRLASGISVPYGLCAHRVTGQVREMGPSGCNRVELAITLPDDGPVVLCAHRVTGQLQVAPSGQCGRVALALTLPDDGPVTVCAHRVTGQLRLAGNGTCTRTEVMREIGGGSAT